MLEGNENDEYYEYVTQNNRFGDLRSATQRKIGFNIDPCLGIPEDDDNDNDKDNNNNNDNRDIPGSF